MSFKVGDVVRYFRHKEGEGDVTVKCVGEDKWLCLDAPDGWGVWVKGETIDTYLYPDRWIKINRQNTKPDWL